MNTALIDIRENRYRHWTARDIRRAEQFGVYIWCEGTNGVYWICNDDRPFGRQIEFQILRRAQQWCDLYRYQIIGQPRPSELLKNKNQTYTNMVKGQLRDMIEMLERNDVQLRDPILETICNEINKYRIHERSRLRRKHSEVVSLER